jgi:host factor-I protein
MKNMNKTSNNLQDIFLNNARKNKITLTVYLINGFQIKGYVQGFDSFTVVLECEGKQMMIYKHAISTISPMSAILFNNQMETENE